MHLTRRDLIDMGIRDIEAFRHNLKVKREYLKLTHYALGVKAKVIPSRVTKIEWGETEPTVSEIRRLVRALGVRFERMFDGPNEEDRRTRRRKRKPKKTYRIQDQ